MAQQAIKLNIVAKELPSMSDMVDNIELQEIMKSTARSKENLIEQFEGHKTLPMCELQGLDKQLKSIRGLLKVDVAKKVELQQLIEQGKHKLEEIRANPEYHPWHSRRQQKANSQTE